MSEESVDENIDLLSQKSISSEYSSGAGSIDNYDLQKNLSVVSGVGVGKDMNWTLVDDLNRYDHELKLDDENFPLPYFKPQDKYAKYEPYDIFSLFFNDELINHIVNSTNEYLAKERTTFRFVTMTKERLLEYADLTPNEFRLFLGMKIYFNFLNNNKCSGKLFYVIIEHS